MMVYRRDKRPSFYFEAKLRDGFKQLCTHTHDKKLAQRIEHMWSELADRYRAWDLLEPVIAAPKKISALYDAWEETDRNVEAMRRRFADVDLSPVVEQWNDVYTTRVKADSAAHALKHVRWLIPTDTKTMTSAVTPEWLTDRLAAYPGKRNTQRKVHSSWTSFFDDCVARKIFGANPMNHVARPSRERPPIRFYDIEAVEQIVEWQPTPQRRALMAILYGSSMDVSPAVAIARGDFNPATKEVRGAGTKAHTRDRVLRIADWAWPHVWAYIKTMTPQVKLFDGLTRSGASFWHRQTVRDGMFEPTGAEGVRGGIAKLIQEPLKLGASYPLRYSRHHWAVRALRAGTPVAVVQRQLGHSSPTVTLDVYGQFLPDAADRAKWEEAATAYDITKREAK
jgi:integrase